MASDPAPLLFTSVRAFPLTPEARFLDKIKQVLRVFILAIHGHPYSFASRFLFLQTHATSYSFYSSVIVQEKRGKPDRKPYPFPYGLKNTFRNLKSENSRRNCAFMKSASVQYSTLQLKKPLHGSIPYTIERQYSKKTTIFAVL